MAAHVTVTLDTLEPQGLAVVINSSAANTTSRDVSVAVTTTDSSTTSYQVKIWGDVDESANANIQQDEVDSAWISLASPHSVRLSTGDGVKTVYAKMRDDVHNANTSAASDTITLDTAAPVVTANAPSPTKISKVASKDTTTFTWSADATFDEFKVKVVSDGNDAHTAGTVIGTTNGSTDMTGVAGGYAASTNRTASIKGADLEAASAGDGAKIIKVFVRDTAGNWSN